jgi:hypothetical protein
VDQWGQRKYIDAVNNAGPTPPTQADYQRAREADRRAFDAVVEKQRQATEAERQRRASEIEAKLHADYLRAGGTEEGWRQDRDEVLRRYRVNAALGQTTEAAELESAKRELMGQAAYRRF